MQGNEKPHFYCEFSFLVMRIKPVVELDGLLICIQQQMFPGGHFGDANKCPLFLPLLRTSKFNHATAAANATRNQTGLNSRQEVNSW